MKLLIGGLVLVILTSCAFYNEKHPGDVSTISAQNVSWERVSNEVLEPRCAICHGQGGAGVDISDYNAVVQNINRINEQVLVKQSMPADSPLTAYEQTLLSVWIQSGMPYAATGGGQ